VTLHRSPSRRLAPGAADVDRAVAAAQGLRGLVEAHVTPERVERYLRALCVAPAPSSVASLCRSPVLERLWAEDGAFEGTPAHFDPDLLGTGNAALITGAGDGVPPLWFVAHLDTISYLVRPAEGGRYPLVPFCYHLTESGERPAEALRYDPGARRMTVVARGTLLSLDGQPLFVPEDGPPLRPGDRVVPVAPVTVAADGTVTGHLDNAGGVAALAVAAPVLARAGIAALFAFPDEEEGPGASGNQSIGRGMSRLTARLDAPDLAVVVDVQQAASPDLPPGTPGRPGAGAVLSEFSSLARGAVTPPPLYAAARALFDRLEGDGARVGEPGNAYTSRSDDVSLMLRTQSILLLGFPGTDRHFDRAVPSANLGDIVALAKAVVYVSALGAMMAGGGDD